MYVYTHLMSHVYTRACTRIHRSMHMSAESMSVHISVNASVHMNMYAAGCSYLVGSLQPQTSDADLKLPSSVSDRKLSRSTSLHGYLALMLACKLWCTAQPVLSSLAVFARYCSGLLLSLRAAMDEAHVRKASSKTRYVATYNRWGRKPSISIDCHSPANPRCPTVHNKFR